VMAGQVALDRRALRSEGILAAYAIADYAGSVRLALADAANQLMGLASYVAARLGNRDSTRYL
jgi:glycerate 2-kinase